MGRATLDVAYSLDRFPAEDTKVFARAMQAAPGGPAVNAAITYALLGGSAALMAPVGGGPWATPVRGDLKQLGIALIDLAAGTAYEAPLTTVLVNGANATRTIVNPPQSDVDLKSVSAWDPAWGGMSSLVLADGFYLEQALPVLRILREAGAVLCLDGGSWKPGTDLLASMLTVAICSERFKIPGTPADPTAIFDWFAERGVPHVAVTRGPKSILGWDRGSCFEIEIAKIDAVDTLGAGDVLHGAFCYHLAKGQEFEAALRLASGIATRSCQALGIRKWTDATVTGADR